MNILFNEIKFIVLGVRVILHEYFINIFVDKFWTLFAFACHSMNLVYDADVNLFSTLYLICITIHSHMEVITT